VQIQFLNVSPITTTVMRAQAVRMKLCVGGTPFGGGGFNVLKASGLGIGHALPERFGNPRVVVFHDIFRRLRPFVGGQTFKLPMISVALKVSLSGKDYFLASV
jgi:hypothetical protein